MSEEPIDIEEIVTELRPYLKAMIQTIGMAGSATTNPDNKVIPGDIKAASIGVELVTKYLSGKGASRGKDILREINKIRALANADAAESISGSDSPDESGEGTPME